MVSLIADPLVLIAPTIPFFTGVKRGQRKLTLFYNSDSPIPAIAINPIVVTNPNLKRNMSMAAAPVRTAAMDEIKGRGIAPQLFTWSNMTCKANQTDYAHNSCSYRT